MSIRRIAYVGVVVITVAVALVIAIPVSQVAYVHWHRNSVRTAILASDLSALNAWAEGVFKKMEINDRTMVTVPAREYCEIIRESRPQSVLIEKVGDRYRIQISLSGAFIPSSVTVIYDKDKEKEQCVFSGK